MYDRWTERKVKPRLWKFKYTEVLYRKPKIKCGTIRARQKAIKTGTNTYALIMKGHRYRRTNKWKHGYC